MRGQFAVPHGTAAYVCSPMHSTMNASFIVSGLLTIAGAIVGGMERVSDYPASLWVLMIGIIAVLSAGTPRASVRQPE